MDSNYKKAFKAAKFLIDVLEDVEQSNPDALEHKTNVADIVTFLEGYIKAKLFEEWKEAE